MSCKDNLLCGIDKNVLFNTLNEIKNSWNTEARQEDSKYFYSLDIIDKVKSGKTCYIIGRKGMGKTAISEYLCKNRSNMEFSIRLSFKNFPFNYLYSMEDHEYTRPNQYISIWKYVIYNSICKLMGNNEGVDSSVTATLQRMYESDFNPSNALSKLIKHWTAKDFGFQIKGTGVNIGLEQSFLDNDWLHKSEIFENIISRYAGEYSYYVLIDELDEDYHNFYSEQERQNYFQLLTSLFKAVQIIRAEFSDKGHRIYPVIFLRDDIYYQIKDSDKNKWREYKTDLFWDKMQLYKMICNRLYISSDKKMPKSDIWNIIFCEKNVKMGNRQQKSMSVLDYITRSSQLRPRDFIYYVRKCAELALDYGLTYISSAIVKETEKYFSDYLRDEITDEIAVQVPNVDEVYSILSQIRKQSFKPEVFIKAYSELPNHTEEQAKRILLQLFNFGIIGNAPSMRNQQIFKYQYQAVVFNFNETVIIHRGMYKALQIF